MGEEFMKFERYFDEKMYKMQNTEEIRQLQIQKLRKRVDEFCKKIPMLKALLDTKGVKSPESITLDEFKAAIPLRIQREAAASQPSEKPSANLVETQAARAGISPSDFRILASTSGTTGEPSPYFLTELDLNLQAQGMTRMLYFVTNGDIEEIRKFVVLEAFALCMAGAGTPGVVTFIMCGLPVIPVGAETKTQKSLEIAEKFGANLFFGTPSLAEHMVDIDPEALKRIKFKRLICGAEPGLDVPGIR
jgi:phenylacetate-CoA ligase